jgi:hypothetical protein
MPSGIYLVVSVLSALKPRPAAEYGRFRLSAIPVGAQIEVEGTSDTLSGMIEAKWNGQIYILFPSDLEHKTQPIAA